MDRYSVMSQTDIVGTVDIVQEGLYLCFRCRCQTPDDGVYRLYAACGSQTFDLGILVPEGECASTLRRVPRKEFTSDKWKFFIAPGYTAGDRQGEILDINQPCRSLGKLHKARLRIEGNKYYMVL